MPEHFSDRLLDAIRSKNAPVCVGFDPLIERLPKELAIDLARAEHRSEAAAGRDPFRARAEAVTAFGRGVIEAVAPLVPAIKINIAFFEPLYAEGIRAYHALVAAAHDAGLLVIGDVKRADIGHTTAQYADAQLGVSGEARARDIAVPDAVTVNPYFGLDGVKPFIDRASAVGSGVFVLVQTSNESASAVQGLKLGDGSTVADRVAEMVQAWAGEPALVGKSGYSCVGAVVSPRDLESTRRIRSAMPNCLFLVPGFGAQGRSAEEVAMCFKSDGTGAIVNASRSVIYAFQDAASLEQVGGDWRACVARACEQFVGDVRGVLPK
jgi:orotidine-5'-phosphate decarboxylase